MSEKREVVFCTNCGMEWYLKEIKFTISTESNHLMGICPECHWNEFSVDDDITVNEEYKVYPEPKFYIEEGE